MRALEMRKSLVRIPSPAGTTRYARIFSLPNSIERSIRTQDFSKDPVFNCLLGKGIIVRSGSGLAFCTDMYSAVDQLAGFDGFKTRSSEVRKNPGGLSFDSSSKRLVIQLLKARYGNAYFDAPQTADFSTTGITSEGMRNLSTLTSLRHLNLSRTGITDKEMECLSGLTSLETLNLSHTAITDDGLRYLSGLEYLRHLVLIGTETTEGEKHLAFTQKWNDAVNRSQSPLSTGDLVAYSWGIFRHKLPPEEASSFLRLRDPENEDTFNPGEDRLFTLALELLNDGRIRSGNAGQVASISYRFLYEHMVWKDGKNHPLQMDDFLASEEKIDLFVKQLERELPLIEQSAHNSAPIVVNSKNKFDRGSFHLTDSGFISIYNPRLRLGTLSDLRLEDSHNASGRKLRHLLYMPSDISPIYIVDDHSWALYCWAEAAARGDISANGNTLLHLDDHKDGADKKYVNRDDFPGLLGIFCALKYGAKYPDFFKGIDFFITTALNYGLVDDFWYIRGEEYPLTAEWQRYDDWMHDRSIMIDGFDHEPTPPQQYTETPSFHLRAVRDSREHVKALEITAPRNKTILDIDVDVDHGDEPIYALAFIERLKDLGLTPGVITIALSPPENYIFNDVHNTGYFQKAIKIAKALQEAFWQ